MADLYIHDEVEMSEIIIISDRKIAECTLEVEELGTQNKEHLARINKYQTERAASQTYLTDLQSHFTLLRHGLLKS